MKAIVALLKEIFDVFNLGRLVFYAAAGFLVALPASMILRLPAYLENAKSPVKGFFTVSQEILNDSLTDKTELLIVSTIVGFLIATVGFEVIIKRLSQTQKYSPTAGPEAAVNKGSFPYMFPFLKSTSDKSNSAWIIGEYYRFVEIAIYIPLGLYIGLMLFALYTALFVVFDVVSNHGLNGLDAAHWMLWAVVLGCSFLRFYVWPNFWRPKIVLPVIKTFQGAKQSLFEGVHDHQQLSKPEE